jgi:hypothetical protein
MTGGHRDVMPRQRRRQNGEHERDDRLTPSRRPSTTWCVDANGLTRFTVLTTPPRKGGVCIHRRAFKVHGPRDEARPAREAQHVASTALAARSGVQDER